MFPRPTPQMPPISPGASILGRGMLQGSARQLGNFPLQQGVMGQSGGILSKLLGGAQAGGGGFTNILNMLQNAQKAIGVFQQVSPMVQQYAPFLKSLPSLISMMRNSSSSDEESETSEVAEPITIEDENETVEEKKLTKTRKKKNKTKKIKATEHVVQQLPKKKAVKIKPGKQQRRSSSTTTSQITSGVPAPKLYI